MSGQQVGYLRVSTQEQNTQRQLDGVELDKRFEDKASGKDTKRPELERCLSHLREGDVLHVHSMDRLARSLDDLRKLVKDLNARGVVVRFHKENITFTGDDSPMANLLLSMLGAVGEFERTIIRERQREGIVKAKERGVYKGRKPALTPEQVSRLQSRATSGESKALLARDFKISRETVYQYIKAAPAVAEVSA
jgi:DNA invertase Pin-like site-specific DNA recombinase